MWVDYTDLNKHCPKDPFGLPRIDEVVDSTVGCELLSFLDCYSSYHQISLKEDDQIKTSFITPFGAYCYTTMSFGLKNAGATYQHAIQQCLHDEIHDDLVEAYVDDVVIKTRDASTLIDHLDRTFKALNKYKWKLNPIKCIFGVPSGILLGNVVSRDGIRPNPTKVRVCDVPPPRGRVRLHLAAFLGHSQPPQTNTSLFYTLCPHLCAPEKYFPVGHPSLNFSRPSTLNFRVLWRWASGKEIATCWYESPINPIKPWAGCYNLTPLRD